VEAALAAMLGSVMSVAVSRRDQLLGMRVSSILDAHEDALDALIAGGFAPLANPVMRLAMASTVSLGQAFRIRGLSDEAEEALIVRLLELGVV